MKGLTRSLLMDEAWGRILLAFCCYALTVETLARLVVPKDDPRVVASPLDPFPGGSADLASLPPLARWDSVWYEAIAVKGYASDSRFAGFLPLYPALIGGAWRGFGVAPLDAGLWISRAATLAALGLLAAYVRSFEGARPPGLAPGLALLSFPSAFILVSVYSESLFLAATLAAFVCARGGRPWAAAVAAAAAGLTRIHGLALIPALGVLGWTRWRGGDRAASNFAPPLVVAVTYACLITYFATVHGDPLSYFTAKRTTFDTKFAFPWETMAVSLGRLERALERGGWGPSTSAWSCPACGSCWPASIGTADSACGPKPCSWPAASG